MIDLWTARFSELTPERTRFAGWLSRDERERADRFAVAIARERFILSRGFLRRTLAVYLRAAPEDLRFGVIGRGKPVLPDSGYVFNLSHADDLLLLGVMAGDARLGVDVERIRPMPEMPTVARSHFSDVEQEAFFSLPPDEQMRAFYMAWTRKEAFIKATGDGFRMPLKSFSVTLKPDEPAHLLHAEQEDAARWSLIHLTPAEGYVGAICVEGEAVRLPRFRI